MGVFPKASKNWIVARNLTFPFEIMIFKFPFGNGVAKPVVSHSKVKIIMVLRVRLTLFGLQFSKLFYLRFHIHTCYLNVVCAA